ncbi:MAG: hypothetical protein CL536_10190 [Alcaligenaceae bacterium]|nr:hypothetical protein [Alcaligenaceae bacterium]
MSYRLFPLILVLLLAACSTQPSVSNAPVILPDSFSETGQQPVSDTWWKSFDDQNLNQLVRRALDENLSLQAAYQRLLQARAVAERQEATLYPSVDASGGAERQEGPNNTDVNLFSVGLSASYEVDLWGRVQSLADADQFRASATLADYQAAAISLSGEIANTWFQLLAQRAQRDLAQRQLDTNRNVLTVIETRFGVGLSSSADVLRQRQLVAASVDRINETNAQIGVLENQLAVLVGQSPGRVQLPDGDALPTLPELPKTGIPAELVQRRPDLQQAWWLIQAADRELAAAISNRFPRFSIDVSLSSQSRGSGDLFYNWLLALAGNLVMPVVDGGERRAEVRRSQALREERVREYGQAVLTAIQEVEDALTREQEQRRRLENLATRIQLADATYRQLRNRYLNGAVSYIEVLDALQEQQDLRRTQLATRQQSLSNRVALYRALAGSIETLEQPSNNQNAINSENDSL